MPHNPIDLIILFCFDSNNFFYTYIEICKFMYFLSFQVETSHNFLKSFLMI